MENELRDEYLYFIDEYNFYDDDNELFVEIPEYSFPNKYQEVDSIEYWNY